MKKSLLLLTALIGAMNSGYAQAPTFERYIPQALEPIKNTRVQNDGSYFEGLKKYNADGTLAWDNNYTGVDIISRIEVADITDDGAGGALVVGRVKGKVYRGTDTITATGGAYSNVFVARFSATGKMWHFVNTCNDATFAKDDDAVAIKKVGVDVYVTGNIASRDFSFGTYNFPRTTSDPANRMFFAKFGMDGSLGWAKFTSGTRATAKVMCKDASDQFYILGELSGSGSVTFATGFTLAGNSSDRYFAKYDKDGNVLLVKGVLLGLDGEINGIAADENANVYLAGFTGREFDVEGTMMRSDVSYLMKFSSTGSYQWIRTLSPSGKTTAVPGVYYLNGYLYIAGTVSGATGNYLQTNAADSASLNVNKLVVARYSPSGVSDWHMQGVNTVYTGAVGTVSYLHATPDGNALAIGGYFFSADKYDTLNIPNAPGILVRYGYIVAKVGGATSVAPEKQQLAADLYPNPTNGTFSIALARVAKNVAIQVMDVSGKIVADRSYNNTSNCSINIQQAPGMYLVHIVADDEETLRQVTKQ